MTRKTPPRGTPRSKPNPAPQDTPEAAELPPVPTLPGEGSKNLPKELPEERPYVRLVPPGVAEREENLIYLLHSALVECLECLKGTDVLTWSAEFESDLALESFEAWQATARPAKE